MPEKRPATERAPRIVVMGVSGCGKSTFGARLGAALRLPFLEGDLFHPPENRAAMAAGRPLDDAMRGPWLDRLAQALTAYRETGCVLSCSALKRAYRDRLRQAGPLLFLHLALDPQTARARVGTRSGHYMPATLVESQFAALEPPAADEAALVLDATASRDALVQAALSRLAAGRR
ncbi:gluconokinase [Celeribacter indicus]|uniref:Gluconokinase n=1 Tax=Celeribacter indicus TaxID=1208324 RepID=A0A0B5E3H8_9RHOB|nr:gluconokinase [Celeribacter indicus]AJE46977.1 thermoresistant glucokinase family carbohydrate kinase [Celeribacter indicus]SDX64770.1 gluconate kinase, SKI family [Celeribacter indicus]